MPEKPLISIITVNLNGIEGLKRTMTSIIGQTFKEFEYIVIDGGSTDGSKEYIESHSDKIDTWVSEKDSGIYNAMNKGIKAATGEYLLFLNSGDWLHDKNVLKLVVENLVDCDVLYGNMIKVFPDGREHLDKGVNGEKISLQTFVDGNLNHQATFIKKDLFEEYGLYDENIRIVADWKFFLISLGMNNSKVKYLDIEISCFDMTGLSSNFKSRDEERLKVLQEELPVPIYTDYLKLKKIETTLKSNRIIKFMETDNKFFSRKLHSIIFRIFS